MNSDRPQHSAAAYTVELAPFNVVLPKGIVDLPALHRVVGGRVDTTYPYAHDLESHRLWGFGPNVQTLQPLTKLDIDGIIFRQPMRVQTIGGFAVRRHNEQLTMSYNPQMAHKEPNQSHTLAPARLLPVLAYLAKRAERYKDLPVTNPPESPSLTVNSSASSETERTKHILQLADKLRRETGSEQPNTLAVITAQERPLTPVQTLELRPGVQLSELASGIHVLQTAVDTITSTITASNTNNVAAIFGFRDIGEVDEIWSSAMAEKSPAKAARYIISHT